MRLKQSHIAGPGSISSLVTTRCTQLAILKLVEYGPQGAGLSKQSLGIPALQVDQFKFILETCIHLQELSILVDGPGLKDTAWWNPPSSSTNIMAPPHALPQHLQILSLRCQGRPPFSGYGNLLGSWSAANRLEDTARFIKPGYSFDDAFFHWMVSSFPSFSELKKIHLCPSDDISEFGLGQLTQTCKMLQEVCLECYAQDPPSLIIGIHIAGGIISRSAPLLIKWTLTGI